LHVQGGKRQVFLDGHWHYVGGSRVLMTGEIGQIILHAFEQHIIAECPGQYCKLARHYFVGAAVGHVRRINRVRFANQTASFSINLSVCQVSEFYNYSRFRFRISVSYRRTRSNSP
jgi:hypothetical protein